MAKKTISPEYLERAAFHYLGRYASSAANLETVLVRKVRRRKDDGAFPNDEEKGWIRAVRDKCERLGLVNDAEYARAKAVSLNRSGKPGRQIRQALRHKGIHSDIIDDVLSALDAEMGEQADWEAAKSYARRRRFGPWRRGEADPDRLRKEEASMARAGHKWDLIRRIIEASDELALEEAD